MIKVITNNMEDNENTNCSKSTQKKFKTDRIRTLEESFNKIVSQ